MIKETGFPGRITRTIFSSEETLCEIFLYSHDKVVVLPGIEGMVPGQFVVVAVRANPDA